MDIPHHIWEHHIIGYVSTNCYVFGRPDQAVMVDPGGPEVSSIVSKLLENEITVKHVLVTHGHFDHLGWAADVQKLVQDARVYLHVDEKPAVEPFLDRMPSLMGIPKLEFREPDEWITDNQILEIGGFKFKVIHTPGHSPGSSTFQLVDHSEDLNEKHKDPSSYVGDLIFESSIGRVDLPFSNPEHMVTSLKRIMNELDLESTLYPGHGNITTLKREIQNNPYLRAIQSGIPIF